MALYRYDSNGFNRNGMHKKTGTKYDLNGFDRFGIHRLTGTKYDLNGFDRSKTHKETRTSYDLDGYDLKGFNQEGLHKETGTRYDLDGYDILGYDKNGFDRNGFDKEGYDEQGYDFYEFNRDGIHKKTGAKYDLFYFNQEGINQRTGTKYGPSYNGGYNRGGYNKNGFDGNGFDKEGYDEKGYDLYRFNREGIHKTTRTEYDKKGYDQDGFNSNGFTKDGLHRETGTKYNLDGYDKDGYNEEGYNREGYNKEGYNSKGIDKDGFYKNGINDMGINKETGEKDERIKFIEEFISSGKTIKMFARDKNMKEEQVKAIIEEVREIEYIKEQIDKALNGNANRFVNVMMNQKNQLLSGKISIKDAKSINRMLKFCNPEERERITEMLIRAISSHDITVLEYKSIFGIEEFGEKLPQRIITEIKSISDLVKRSNKKDIRLLATEFYKEKNRIKGYEQPYVPTEDEKLGFYENPNDKEPKMFLVTDEQKEIAMQYLKATDEFICRKTMNTTIIRILKGEIDAKKVQRAKKERELEELQHEDEKLDELIKISERINTAKRK